MNPSSTRTRPHGAAVFLLVVVALLCALPFLAQKYTVTLITEILIFGLLAASLDLCLGYTGLASLAHAAFFGAGAYAVGILATKAHCTNVFIVVPVAILVSALLALVVGFFSLRTSGIYFLMITLAFGQMVFALVHKWNELTGGSDGCSLGKRPVIDLLAPYVTVDIGDYRHFYFLVLATVLLSLFALKRVVRLPLGQVAVGIRENEVRVKFMGFNTFGYKLAVFVISGAFAGLSGVLYMYFNAFVSPEEVNWIMSGKVLVMVILGGVGTIFGPLLGAGTLLLTENWLSSYTERWLLILGLLFVFFVLFAPEGIVGIVRGAVAKWHKK
jgi:branched-chain amino acid transport system permease protein